MINALVKLLKKLMLRVCFIHNIANYIRKFYDVTHNSNETILITYMVGSKIWILRIRDFGICMRLRNVFSYSGQMLHALLKPICDKFVTNLVCILLNLYLHEMWFNNYENIKPYFFIMWKFLIIALKIKFIFAFDAKDLKIILINK